MSTCTITVNTPTVTQPAKADPSPKESIYSGYSMAKLHTERNINLIKISDLMKELERLSQIDSEKINHHFSEIETSIHAVEQIDEAAKDKIKKAESSWQGTVWGNRIKCVSKCTKVISMSIAMVLTILGVLYDSSNKVQVAVVVALSVASVALQLFEIFMSHRVKKTQKEIKAAKKLSLAEVMLIREQILPLRNAIQELIAAANYKATTSITQTTTISQQATFNADPQPSHDELSNLVKNCIETRNQVTLKEINLNTGTTSEVIKIASVEEWVSVSLAQLPEDHPLRIRFNNLVQRAQSLRHSFPTFGMNSELIPPINAFHANPSSSSSSTQHQTWHTLSDQHLSHPSNYQQYDPLFTGPSPVETLRKSSFNEEWDNLLSDLNVEELQYIHIRDKKVTHLGKCIQVPCPVHESSSEEEQVNIEPDSSGSKEEENEGKDEQIRDEHRINITDPN